MEFLDAAVTAFRKGDREYAAQIAEAAQKLAHNAHDVRREVEALLVLARVALGSGEVAEGAEHIAEARVKAQGDSRLEQMCSHMEALVARMLGDLATARDLYRRSLDLSESLGDGGAAAAEYRSLAYVELQVHNRERAKRLFLEARRRSRQSGYERLLPFVVADAAVLAMEEGDAARAATLAGAAMAALAAADEILEPVEIVENDRVCARAREVLGEQAFHFYFRVGGKLSLVEAVERM